MTDDDWNPTPAALRSGETRDDTHASRNLAQLQMAHAERDATCPKCGAEVKGIRAVYSGHILTPCQHRAGDYALSEVF